MKRESGGDRCGARGSESRVREAGPSPAHRAPGAWWTSLRVSVSEGTARVPWDRPASASHSQQPNRPDRGDPGI